MRLAGAIALETLALVVWNVGTRSPLQLARDVVHSLSDPRALLSGILSTIVGAIFAIAATLLILPALADPDVELIPLVSFTFIAALVIELLVGEDVRRLASGSRSPEVR